VAPKRMGDIMSLRFIHEKPKPGKTDWFSQVIAKRLYAPSGKSSTAKDKDRSKAYSTNRTKPRKKKR
jgi:hypothetical protein